MACKKIVKRPKFSKALIKIARSNLKQSIDSSNEGFLIRAEIERKLNYL
jgi:hypothetical protein